MDQAVGLVQAYLRLNGYFTVTEYPVIVPDGGGGYRTATDLDILAVRFPHVGQGSAPGTGEPSIPDPALGAPPEQADMLIGEVKEGRAELNAGATDPAVLHAVLTRFGCCDEHSAPEIIQDLKRRGHAILPTGHPARLVAFGSTPGEPGGSYLRITHGQILRFLQDHLRRHWTSIRITEAKDPAFGFLLLLEKAQRGGR
jgi:hypothetical protein